MKSEECSFWKSPDKKNNTGIRNITSNVFFFYLDDFKKCFKMVKNLELLGTDHPPKFSVLHLDLMYNAGNMGFLTLTGVCCSKCPPHQ